MSTIILILSIFVTMVVLSLVAVLVMYTANRLFKDIEEEGEEDEDI